MLQKRITERYTAVFIMVWLMMCGWCCNICYGLAAERRQRPQAPDPNDMKLLATGRFTNEQVNSYCASCHSEMKPMTGKFKLGERYFDHFDLVITVSSDFCSDRKQLSAQSTYTQWRMSPCAKSGKLNCMHCHTSSGRYRFADMHDDNACFQCHKDQIKTAAAHSHHPAESKGSRCISCHMPQTEIGLRRRTDHSMLPPSPAATIKYGTPNACNQCHKDKSAVWADEWVRKWYPDDYQSEVLDRVALIDSAQRQDWSSLSQMLDYIGNDDRDEITATSLIRLLGSCDDKSKWPAIRKSLKDPSALIRSAAAAALAGDLSSSSDALLKATSDEYLVVRIRASHSLSAYHGKRLKPEEAKRLETASNELLRAMLLAVQNEPENAQAAFDLGVLLAKDRIGEAVTLFSKAYTLEPDNPQYAYHLAYILNECGDCDGAIEKLKPIIDQGLLYPEAYSLLAVIYQQQGKPNRAAEIYQRASSIEKETIKQRQ